MRRIQLLAVRAWLCCFGCLVEAGFADDSAVLEDEQVLRPHAERLQRPVRL